MADHIQIPQRLCRTSVDENYGIGAKYEKLRKKESNDGDWVPARRAVFCTVFLPSSKYRTGFLNCHTSQAATTFSTFT